jgi:hypothetical protein
LICAGDTIRGKRAMELGVVFDAVPSEKLMEEAKRILADLHASGIWKADRAKRKRPIGLSEEQHQFTFAVARGVILEKTKGQMPAPLVALDAIEKGCNRTLDEGLAVETDVMVPLVGSPISKNLISIFFMQQRVAKDPGVADATVVPRKVTRVGVLGAGIMGAGIASAHLRKAIPVVLLDSNPQALEKGVMGIAAVFKAQVDRGRMKPEDLVANLARLGTAASRALPNATSRSKRSSRTRRPRRPCTSNWSRCCGPTPSSRPTRRPSPSREWPNRWPSPIASPDCTSSTPWKKCRWSK